MDLILKITQKCNFKCTFCSSTDIADDDSQILEIEKVFQFLKRYPNTNTIIINGGDPLMVDPEYYWGIINFLEENNLPATISMTSNLWPFLKKPEKWVNLFKHPRVGVTTSFQYGGGRLKGDLTEFSESDFWEVSDAMLHHVGYRPDFISVITEENEHFAIDNVKLAKKMGVECKLNYAMSSGPPVKFKGITMGQQGKPYLLAKAYELYVKIWELGLTDWEFNTKQMVNRLRGRATSCPQNRSCDEGIRALQPDGSYYSCGAFGDDKKHRIDFDEEMKGKKIFPLRNLTDLASMKNSCWTCPMFEICNGCRKTISDLKEHGLVESHCYKMKQLAPKIIAANNMTGVLIPTEYVNERI